MTSSSRSKSKRRHHHHHQPAPASHRSNKEDASSGRPLLATTNRTNLPPGHSNASITTTRHANKATEHSNGTLPTTRCDVIATVTTSKTDPKTSDRMKPLAITPTPTTSSTNSKRPLVGVTSSGSSSSRLRTGTNTQQSTRHHYRKAVAIMVAGGLIFLVGIAMAALYFYDYEQVYIVGPICLSVGLLLGVCGIVWIPIIQTKLRRQQQNSQQRGFGA